MAEPTWIRVKDKDTGYIRTIRSNQQHLGNYQVLKQDAVSATGDPLPDEFPVATTPAGQKAETTKEKS